MNREKRAGTVLAVALLLGSAEAVMAQTGDRAKVRNVVLVHGGFVDGSGWEGVYKTLKKDGYSVSIVQNPTISLADDVAVTRRVIAAQNGPVDSRRPLVRRSGDHRSRQRSEGCGARLHRRLCSGQGRVRVDAHQGSAARRARAADPAAAGRLSVPRQGEVRGLVRGRRGRGEGRVHGRLPGPVGRGGAERQRSASRRGGPSRAGTWSPPTTR